MVSINKDSIKKAIFHDYPTPDAALSTGEAGLLFTGVFSYLSWASMQRGIFDEIPIFKSVFTATLITMSIVCACTTTDAFRQWRKFWSPHLRTEHKENAAR
jgi:hypothetical protein